MKLSALTLGLSLALGAAGLAVAEPRDRFWILWERYQNAGQDCPNGPRCITKRAYTSRLFAEDDTDAMYRLFGMMDGTALSQGRLAEHPDAPRICQHNAAEVVLGFDPVNLPKSEKVEALRGLKGFGLDVRSLSAPPGFPDTFGSSLQTELEAKFALAGIKVLSEDEVAVTPGQPKLNIYFSFTDPDGHCDYTYSVFASLAQNVLLTRDLRVKLSAGVWSFSTGSTAAHHTGNERDAILRIADQFIKDHRLTNPK